MAFLGLALVLLLLLSFSVVPPTSSCTEEEKISLLQFVAGLSRQANGGLDVSWRNGTDCCAWEGITCNGNGTVTEVSLASRGLEGRISPSFADLAGLLRLNLSHNSISGGLPLEQLISSSRIVVLRNGTAPNTLGTNLARVHADISEFQDTTSLRGITSNTTGAERMSSRPGPCPRRPALLPPTTGRQRPGGRALVHI